MTKNQDTPEGDQPKTAADFTEMPEPSDFATLDTKLQNDLLAKFAEAEDTDDEPESETEENDQQEEDDQDGDSDDEDSDSEADDSESDDSESDEDADDADETDTQSKDDKPVVDWERRYKDLQSWATKQIEDLKKSVKPAEKAETTETRVRSKFDALAEKNPKAKDFIEELRDGVLEVVKDVVKPISEKLNNADAASNETKFRNKVAEFLDSDLSPLEQAFNVLAANKYGSEDALLEAARKDPAVFDSLKAELIAANLDKVIEIKSRKKPDDPKKKNQEIKDLGVSKKSKTGAKPVDDKMDISSLKSLKSYDDMKRVLGKQGLVDKTAMPKR